MQWLSLFVNEKSFTKSLQLRTSTEIFKDDLNAWQDLVSFPKPAVKPYRNPKEIVIYIIIQGFLQNINAFSLLKPAKPNYPCIVLDMEFLMSDNNPLLKFYR